MNCFKRILPASIIVLFLACSGDFKEITDEERQARLPQLSSSDALSSSDVGMSSSSNSLILCLVGDYCFENIHAETCLHSLKGMIAANCPVSSSSSADVASGSSSSGALVSSSSQVVLVSCQVGPDCISSMPESMCASTGHTVETCEVSSSSVAPSSSSATGSTYLCDGFDSNAESDHYGMKKKQICDERDGKKYYIVTIGTGETAQTWMAENLNYKTPNGLIRCYGNASNDDDNVNCITYGRLYNWATAMNLSTTSPINCNTSNCANQMQSKHRGICPSGWHIPSDEEWTILAKYAGGNGDYGQTGVAGTNLKANSSLWSSNAGTDTRGFSALPGGSGSDGNFNNVGSFGYWLSSTESDSLNTYYRYIMNSNTAVNRHYTLKTVLLSVRCLQN